MTSTTACFQPQHRHKNLLMEPCKFRNYCIRLCFEQCHHKTSPMPFCGIITRGRVGWIECLSLEVSLERLERNILSAHDLWNGIFSSQNREILKEICGFARPGPMWRRKKPVGRDGKETVFNFSCTSRETAKIENVWTRSTIFFFISLREQNDPIIHWRQSPTGWQWNQFTDEVMNSLILFLIALSSACC